MPSWLKLFYSISKANRILNEWDQQNSRFHVARCHWKEQIVEALPDLKNVMWCIRRRNFRTALVACTMACFKRYLKTLTIKYFSHRLIRYRGVQKHFQNHLMIFKFAWKRKKVLKIWLLSFSSEISVNKFLSRNILITKRCPVLLKCLIFLNRRIH